MLDVVPATIRNWEKSGIFSSRRSENNYRIYSFNDIEILRRIFDYSVNQNMDRELIKKLINQDQLLYQRDFDEDYKFTDLVQNKRFKECRKNMRLSKTEVSASVGITEEELTGIEDGNIDITYGLMAKLATLYGEGVLSFLDLDFHSREPVIRNGEGKTFSSGLKGVDMECLNEDTTTGYQMVKCKVQPGCGSYTSHKHQYGYEYMYILEGELKVILDNRNEYIIKKNDSIQFSSTKFHCWSNSSENKSVFLWIHSKL